MTAKSTEEQIQDILDDIKEVIRGLSAHLDVKIVHDQPEPEPGMVYHTSPGSYYLRGDKTITWGSGSESEITEAYDEDILAGADKPKIATLDELVETHKAHKELVEAVRAFLGSVDKDGDSWERVCKDYGDYPRLHTTVAGAKRLHELTRKDGQP